MLSLAVVTVLSIPNLASAKEVDLLIGKQFYSKGYNPQSTFVKGRESSYGYLYRSEVIADLGKEIYVTRFNYSAQGGVHFSYIAFFDSNFREIWTQKTEGGKGEYTVGIKARYVSVGNSGTDNSRFSWVSVYGDDGLVSDVSNLKASSDKNKVTLNWKNPEGEENFKGLRIYQGSNLIAQLDNKVNSYVVEGLKGNKSYVFTVKSVDQNGVETNGVSVNAKALMPLIDPPKNVYVTPQNGSLIINWESVNSEFFKGYNVYIDGKKVSNELLTSNKLILKNMENDKKYSVQVSAVNLEDKEGNKSAAVIESPSKNATTIEYDFKPPLTAMEFLETSGTIVLWLSPFILVGLAVIWFKPLKKLIVQAVLDHRKKGEKK